MHARDQKTGEPTGDLNTFAAIIEGIRKYNKQLILCVSLSGRNVSDPALRALPLSLDGEAKPDMGSLTLSSMNFATQASINAPGTINYLAGQMALKGISPEVEIFDSGMSSCPEQPDQKIVNAAHCLRQYFAGQSVWCPTKFRPYRPPLPVRCLAMS